jgi:tRNA dimethylallyltransferase
MIKEKNIIMIVGPTGVGKTDLSIDIAKHFKSEIFSCDSRQIYKELNIGVAKPTEKQLAEVKHNFINHKSIHEHYSISKYEVDVIENLKQYFDNNNIAIFCGGSGLYVDAICNGVDEMPDHDEEIRKQIIELYNTQGIEALRFELRKIDPKYYEQVDLKNPQRIMRAIEVYKITGCPFSSFRKNKAVERDFNIIKIGINIDRSILHKRINKRVDMMVQNGLANEVRELHKHKGLVALKTIGYSEFFDCFENKTSREKAIELTKRNTRHYAKRQLTWFSRYSDIKWFTPSEKKNIINYINSKINITN